MLSIEDGKAVLSQLGMSDKDLKKYEKYSKTAIKFHKYLMKKLDISSKDAEELTKNYSKNYILNIKNVNPEDTEAKDLFEIAGESLKMLAEEHEYPYSEKLGENYTLLTKLIMEGQYLKNKDK